MTAFNLPDLFSLSCFVTLAKTLSFSETARQVHLSPAALSDRIKRLEESLGEPLFIRTTRNVRLSSHGEALLPSTQRLLNEAWRWREELEIDIAKIPYTLKIGTRFELGMSWIVPSLSELKSQESNRTIQLVWGVDQRLINALLEGEVDGVISSVRVDHTDVRAAPLHREDYVFVSIPDYAPISLTASEADEYALIDTEAGLPLFRYFLDALPSGEAWSFRELELLGTIAAVRARVLDGAGVAVLPSYFVEEDLRCGRLVRLRPEIELQHDFFRFLWHTDQPRDESVQRLISELRAIPLS